jgi:1-acyl-sn-glycerol-3-phosphate acyltransferase
MTARALLRLFAMALWFAVCATIHLAVRRFGPSPWPRRLLGGVGWIAGARVATSGAKPAAKTLIVANHVSWLDIPVLAGATNCAFVAKNSLRSHAFLRWLCEENGTVFIERERRGTLGEQIADMEAAVRNQKPLTLFPEGTVSDGGRLLPFRSSLLKLAEDPQLALTVQPVAIDYGPHAADFGWPADESGQANFLRLLGRRGTVAINLHFLCPLAQGQDRKALTKQAEVAICLALSGGEGRAGRV